MQSTSYIFMKFAKWIAGGLGWVLGGPIGGLLGFAIGALADEADVKTEHHPYWKRNTAEGDFKMSLLVLIACVMKVDGTPKKSQLDVVKRFLVANFGEQEALEALSILKTLLKQYINEDEIARQVGQNMNYASKLELLHLLFAIAYADGSVSNNEFALLKRISGIFYISPLDFESIKAPYTKNEDHNWAYKVLEIEPSATNEEIKKAYRRMAHKYHPDKLNDLGEDLKKSGTEKFRSVKEAYESLKKQRGFS